MAFETFTGKHRRDGGLPLISISKKSGSLNVAALELMGSPVYVQRLYDVETGTVALKPVTDSTAACKVSRFKGRSGGGGIVFLKSFVSHYKIPLGRYRLVSVDDLFVLVREENDNR